MRVLGNNIRLSATDLSHHLACRHVTTLDLAAARGERAAPDWAAPDLVVIQERGRRHEAAYLEFLQNEKKLRISNLSEIREDRAALQETLRLMHAGAEVIAQGALGNAEWFGRPDVLRRVDSPAGNWAWSYEVADTKLSRETKGATILQLSLYSELLEVAQGCAAESMWVVPPGQGFEGERYRVAEYAAYFRYVKDRLARAAANGDGTATYPEPVEHCNVCRWFRECDERRRLDDHLSLVAGIRPQQRNQLEEWSVDTMAALAVLPIPLAQRPRHGSREGIEHVREQARVQVEGRTQKKLIRELLPLAEGIGLARLPEPSSGDVFLDLEGDPFVGEAGLQYLFGFAERGAAGEFRYEKRWALNRAEEKAAFEWLVDEIMRRRELDPRLHIYHFGAYEPGALKRLMGLYATREDEIDRLLRAGAFVDLHQAFKQAVRASVEEYSLKKLEAFFAFERHTSLDESRKAMRFIEHSLELERNLEKIPDHIRAAMEGYNAEDCFSAAKLRDWLETQRDLWLKRGAGIPRPPERDGAPSEELDERQKRIAALVSRLTRGIPEAAGERSETQQACWLLAQLLDWHRRENKASWWEGFRLADLDPDDLLEERAGLSGLRFLERLQVDRKIPTDRYQFDEQETEAREERKLYHKGEALGSVIAIDFAKRIIDVKKTRKSADLHPAAVYVWDRPYEVAAHEESLCRVAGWVAENGLDAPGNYRAARDLLLRRPPRLLRSETLAPLPGEAPKDTACRIGCALDHSVFAIQGPPGAGKTFTGARMICELVKQGKKIGITALSHKVIRKLLDEVVAAASESGQPIRCMQKTEDCEPAPQIAIAQDNDSAWGALARGQVHVLGGTSWLWSPEAAFESVDVLFIDEAGQMALADVLAVSQAAKSLVLIGDPQQLERPLKGSHPEGAEKSALEHLLRGEKTIPGDLGFLLPETWRLHPNICEFTSETFYEGRLASRDLLRNRVLQGHPHFHGAGLWFVPVEHSANRNSAPEEVELIAKIVDGLLRPEVQWFYGIDRSRRLDRQKDILVVAPYNAQVAVLSERLPGVKVGTVDKFQGQEAPVVIYSLTTSTPEDAPRGMEFLYSLNRLNVATSRAITAVILVGNSSLFEPQCLTPRQMQLANALCRYRELATVISPKQL